MARWRVVGGPFEYYGSGEAAGVFVGWAWDLEREGETRVTRVEVAKSAATRPVFREAEQALQSILDEDEPPARLLLGAADPRPENPSLQSQPS